MSTPITQFPLEILVLIGIKNPWAWRALLVIPDFACWTLTEHAQKMRHNLIVKKKSMLYTEFYLGTKLHNFDDLPAVIYYDKEKHWYKNGLLHRDNRPARITIWQGMMWDQYWYQNGLLHRDEDKPAKIKWNGTEKWYQNGLLHRDNGPAIIYPNGKTEWYQHGVRYQKESTMIDYVEHIYKSTFPRDK